MTEPAKPWRPSADLEGPTAKTAARLRATTGAGEAWTNGSGVAMVTGDSGSALALLSDDVAPDAAARLAADLVASGRPARLAFADGRMGSAGLEPAGKATFAGQAFEAFRLPDHRHEIARDAPTQPQPEDLAGRARWFSSRFGRTS
jgi:hypothetical protein